MDSRLGESVFIRENRGDEAGAWCAALTAPVVGSGSDLAGLINVDNGGAADTYSDECLAQLGLDNVDLVLRDHDRGQDGDNRDRDHQLDQREATPRLTRSSSACLAHFRALPRLYSSFSDCIKETLIYMASLIMPRFREKKGVARDEPHPCFQQRQSRGYVNNTTFARSPREQMLLAGARQVLGRHVARCADKSP